MNFDKRKIGLIFLCFLLLLGLVATLAFDMLGTVDVSAPYSSEPMIDKVRAKFKNMGDIEVTPFNDYLYEVAILGRSEVFYTDGDLIIVGNIFDNKSVNLTSARVKELEVMKFAETSKSIDMSKAVKIGSGSVEVLEFTDVDCPYCKTAEAFFINSDATRYIYFFPLDEIHPEAALKSEHILCSDEQALEYERVMKGEVKEFTSCDKGKELLAVHRDYAEELGVNGTPMFFINGRTFTGANPAIKELIRHK